MPKVSVIVPNYNHARYLEQRLTSAWRQTFSDAEIIYLDDASTDGSTPILEELLAKNPQDAARTRVELNANNSGSPFMQWNKGAGLARGEYLWFAEADDFADVTLLEKLVAKLDENPAVGIAYCQSWAVNADDEILCSALDFLEGGEMPPLDKRKWQSDFVRDGQQECSRHLVCRNFIPNASAVLMRRAVFEKVGGADETFRVAGDWMLWAKMLLVSDLAFVAEPLNHFRLHQKSVSSATKKSGVEAEENYRVIGEIARRAAIEPQLFEKVCAALLNGWMRPALQGTAKIDREQHLRIYREAKQVDAKLHRRMARRARQSARFRARKIVGLSR